MSSSYTYNVLLLHNFAKKLTWRHETINVVLKQNATMPGIPLKVTNQTDPSIKKLILSIA